MVKERTTVQFASEQGKSLSLLLSESTTSLSGFLYLFALRFTPLTFRLQHDHHHDTLGTVLEGQIVIFIMWGKV